MAGNPFDVNVPQINPLAALMQGYGFTSDLRSKAALQEAGKLYAAGDIKGAQAAVAQGGNLQALMGFGNLANQDRNFAFRQTEAQRAQGNSDRSFGLQERQFGQSAANAAASRDLARQQFEFNKSIAKGYDIQKVKDAQGNETLVRVDRQGNATPIDSGAPRAPTNPYAAPGKMTDAQANAALYADRMIGAEAVLSDPKYIAAAQSPLEQGLGKLEAFGGNYFNSTEYQKVEQAQRDFVNAVLRRESGAVISPDEFKNAAKQYFPRPGDSKEVIAQKTRNRAAAIRGIARAAGPAYQPPNISGPQASQAQSSPQISDGMTATNPQTGQRIMFRNGQWVPAQ